MTDAEKQLVKDVMWYYRRTLGLPPSGLGPGGVSFAVTEDNYEYEPTGSFTLTRTAVAKAVAYAAVDGLLLSGAVMAWAGWYSIANLLFLALVCSLCYFLPVFLAIARQRRITVYYGPFMERELARDMALAYLNSNLLRDWLHATMDALTLPLCFSLQHGLAVWFARDYFATRGQVMDTAHLGLRARLGAGLVGLLARISRGALPRMLLRWG